VETIFIDGSSGEGGGQILRTSLALSCITGKSLHLENIRAARRNPGLAKQHLASVNAAARICSAKCHSDVIGSRTLDFQPGHIQAGDFHFDISSAGSATLVIQTILPVLFLADKPSTVTVTGGTHNPWAPPYDFLCENFLPAIAAAGFHGNCKLIKHGFFPAGGGKITFNVEPWQKNQNQIINLCEPIKNPQIYARIYIAKLPLHISQRQEKLLLQSKLNFQNIEHIEVTESAGPGNCVEICLCDFSRTIIFTAFGMKGKPSEEVVGEVVKLSTDFLGSGAAIDRFLADQLLLYMTIAKAGCFTTNELSSHLKTNIEIIKKFLQIKFNIDQQRKIYRISCEPA
jgi:RNA 3'-terminal phosphate cyclase (ATP)